MADGDELYDVIVVVRNQFLDRAVGANVTEITEDRHKSLAFEWIGLDVDPSPGIRGVNDPFVLNIVCEEIDNDSEQPSDDTVVANNIGRDAGNGEELNGEIFDGGFGFTINQKVGVDNTVIDTSKVNSWKGNLV